MNGQDVHRPSLASQVERDLDFGLPAVSVQDANECVGGRGMRGIQQAVEGLAVPAQADVKPSLEGFGQPLEVGHRHTAEKAAFGPRDQTPRHAGMVGEVLLAPPEPDPKSADLLTESHHVHSRK
ncbi:MAG TPA: hypothetical protein VFI28_05925 [Candidatus Limnocylindrales bacterium]|nr:hypothetical protein [Candidatus Limnocylindrales bacterium]